MIKRKFELKRTDGGTPRVELSSGCDEYPGCTLVVATRSRRLTLHLPQIVKPFRRWIDTSKYEWGKPGGGYFETFPCRYGFYVHEGHHLYVSLGPQTHDSLTTKKWSCFLPWADWRHVRFSLYGAAGEHFWTQSQRSDIRGMDKFAARREAEAKCPHVRFQFADYDGKVIEAITRAQEHEWKRGTKWCAWLSLFVRARVRRSLDIEFTAETGPEKGSWKGGILGAGIELLPGELHEAAFRRYCEKNGMTFVQVQP